MKKVTADVLFTLCKNIGEMNYRNPKDDDPETGKCIIPYNSENFEYLYMVLTSEVNSKSAVSITIAKKIKDAMSNSEDLYLLPFEEMQVYKLLHRIGNADILGAQILARLSID